MKKRVGGTGGREPATRTGDLERQLATAQQITHIGSWEWNVHSGRVTWSDELYRIYGLAPQSCAITFESFLSRVHPGDRERVRKEVSTALAARDRFQYPERVVRPDGTVRHLATMGEVTRDAKGNPTAMLGTCRDVTDELRARAINDTERRVLELIASGAPLAEVLTTLVLRVEEHAPPAIASVLLLDADGSRVLHGAAPHLPSEYNAAVHGRPIGPAAGSCGTAAFRRASVFVTDVETDPLWADYRDLARRFGLRACWSTPILATDGRVLGTFALYYREPRDGSDADRELIARATHVAAMAIERKQLDDQFRALSARIESAREDERTGIAREIHDQLGQTMTALKMDLAWMSRRLADRENLAREAITERLQSMLAMTDDIIRQVRRISTDLRPGVLDDLGLTDALEWQASEFERQTGAVCVVHSNARAGRFDRSVSTTVFRIFQEALTNVARHANAHRVEVTLARDDGGLLLEVRDDGRGIVPEVAARPNSLGILGMRERAGRLGGNLTVAPGASGGTVLRLTLPLTRVPEASAS